MATIMCVSAVTHLLWVLIIMSGLTLTQAREKGTYFMTTTAGSMAFVYPVLLQSERFGKETAAIVVMWEFGGNLIVAILLFGIAASAFAPDRELLNDSSSLRERDQPPAGKPAPEVIGSSAETPGHISAAEFSGIVISEQLPPDVPSSPSKSSRSSVRMQYLSLATAGFRSPMIWAGGFGILLNGLQVPRFPLPLQATKSLMTAFPPLLYAFVGANLRFGLSWESYGTISRALVTRWAMCGIVVAVGRNWWPVDEQTRGVLTLCVVCPVAASFMMWTAKYRYPLDQASMLFNVSAIVSLITMSLIAPIA